MPGDNRGKHLVCVKYFPKCPPYECCPESFGPTIGCELRGTTCGCKYNVRSVFLSVSKISPFSKSTDLLASLSRCFSLM